MKSEARRGSSAIGAYRNEKIAMPPSTPGWIRRNAGHMKEGAAGSARGSGACLGAKRPGFESSHATAARRLESESADRAEKNTQAFACREDEGSESFPIHSNDYPLVP
ncbi:MAG: hypothetical protein ACU841_16690, partial [Gammaproteobacteria bacterium]